MKQFDFNSPLSYAPDSYKKRWHAQARMKLKDLARVLGLEPGSYDIRSNYAGIAVSGDAILHGEHVYVHASQPSFGGDNGIYYRRCNGRKDYTGQRNHFASLNAFHNIEALAAVIERDLGPVYKLNANEVR